MQFKEFFGLFNYVVPTDKEQKLFDFYMLALLRGRKSSKYVSGGDKPFFEPGDFTPGNLENEEDQIDYMLEEVAEKLIPNLKLELMDVLFRAVVSEIKHVFNFNDPDILKLLVKKYHPGVGEDFSSFSDNISATASDSRSLSSQSAQARDGNSEYSDRKHDRDLKNIIDRSNDNKQKVISLVKESFKNVDDFMIIAKTLFLNADWNEGYGGNNWASIVEGYFRLKNASNFNSLIIAIDHVYDLQHNNGSVFEKIPEYGKQADGRSVGLKHHYWIKKALDYKRDVKSASELLSKVSPTMKKLASKIIHIKKI